RISRTPRLSWTLRLPQEEEEEEEEDSVSNLTLLNDKDKIPRRGLPVPQRSALYGMSGRTRKRCTALSVDCQD
ncbi:hypothetical protein M9458_032252, partial [Cirrhinus mrigala]